MTRSISIRMRSLRLVGARITSGSAYRGGINSSALITAQSELRTHRDPGARSSRLVLIMGKLMSHDVAPSSPEVLDACNTRRTKIAEGRARSRQRTTFVLSDRPS